MSAQTSVTILVPGLLEGGGLRRREALDGAPPRPALDRLLARGAAQRRLPATEGFAAAMCAACGLSSAAAEALPVAALSYLGDGGDPGQDRVVRVDPVHLRAELADLTLLDSRALDLDQADADELVECLNEHLAERGLRIEAPCADRWYARMPAGAPAMNAAPPASVAGRRLKSTLAAAGQATPREQLLNEIQMVLAASPANRRRESRGALAVNSVWLWGDGPSPPSLSPCFARMVGGGALGRGLAKLSGAPWEDRDARADRGVSGIRAGDDWLLADERLDTAASDGDAGSWLAALADLERCWFAPVLAGLADGTLTRVEVAGGGDAVRVVRRRDLRRWWRRGRLAALVASQ